jgi:hypothetical protein
LLKEESRQIPGGIDFISKEGEKELVLSHFKTLNNETELYALKEQL